MDTSNGGVDHKNEKPEEFDVEGVTFDENGQVGGVPDNVLDAVAGGLMSEQYNSVCPEVNFNCKC